MQQTNSNLKTNSILLLLLAGITLLVSYFLPWVQWETVSVPGYYMPVGKFFSIADTQFGLANPFPQFNFTFLIFWAVPVLALIIILLQLAKKSNAFIVYLTGFLALTQATIYILFSNVLVTLGVGESLLSMIKPWLWVQALAAIMLVLSMQKANMLKKFAVIVAGPVFAFVGFQLVENYVMNETHEATSEVTAAYTIPADALINEFLTNDTAANKKYFDKVIEVQGSVADVKIQADSLSTIKFENNTGSYAVFSLEKSAYDKVTTIKNGDAVTIKGVCSGSIFSEILGTTSISFKRAIIQ